MSSLFHIDWSRVVAIRTSSWSNEFQDWLAILVLDTGAEIITDLFCKQAEYDMELHRKNAVPE